MNNEIKTTRDFKSIVLVEEIIERWAKSNGFKDSELFDFPDPDNFTYCFQSDEDETKTLLAINLLDDNVHLEAWQAKKVENSCLTGEKINSLLNLLGQNPL